MAENQRAILEKANTENTLSWRNDILAAKTFADIAAVFDAVFGNGHGNVDSYKNPGTPYGLVAGGVKNRERLNQAAKDILARVNRPEDLTPEDAAILRQYSGKGGLTENSQFEYYTPPFVAQGIWDAMSSNGAVSGNILDPCVGAGVFPGTKPVGVVMTGCDIDPSGAKIASLLNPKDSIRNKPFESIVMETPDDTFDGVVGNVPFGDARGKNIHIDPDYKNEKRIERYFILRALDKVKPGGLCCFVVPTGIVGNKDKRWQQFRIAVSKKAEFLGAHKLPSKTFSANGTDTVTDIIVLKKHPKDLLAKIQDLTIDTLRQNLVVWDEFVSGGYWMGEGRQYIMGKYIPKEPGDRWSREVVDGVVDSASIRSKLAAKFHSRINWDGLEVAQPIVRNYVDGDRRIMNGQEYEMVHGDWVKSLQKAAASLQIAGTDYGASSVDELKDMLSSEKGYLQITAQQAWAAYKAFPDTFDETHRQCIEFAMSQPDESIAEQLYRGSVIGAMIGRYQQSVINGTNDDTQLPALQELVSNEISRYGHPANNEKLLITGESSRMFGMFSAAIDKNGNFSDLLAGTLQPASQHQAYDSTNPQSIIEHLTIREGLKNITIDDINKLYSPDPKLTMSDIAMIDNVAITPDRIIEPLSRYCAGDIYEKIQAMQDAMLNEDSEVIKGKWVKQIAEINKRRIVTDPQNISFGLQQKWFSPEYIVNFLRENGYPKVSYGQMVQEEYTDSATGNNLVRKKFQENFDTPFGEFTGIEGAGFPKQFLQYLNGGNVTSSGEGAEERKAAYKQQVASIEENFNVWMKRSADIDAIGEQYNRKFNGYIPYEADESDLGLKNVSPTVRLHPYQNAAVRRLSEEGRGFLSFDVGLGKTYSSLGLIAYNNQMGRSHKTCVVVPDAVLENWYHSAVDFFGSRDDIFFIGYKPKLNKDGSIARVPLMDENGNPKKNKHTGEVEYQDQLVKISDRKQIFEDMWKIPQTSKKIVIMSKEKFGQIPMQPDTKSNYTAKMVEKSLISAKNADSILAEGGAGGGKKVSYADAKKTDKLEQVYSDEGTDKKGEFPFFEQMGFSDVIVDEAHMFKNSFAGGEKTSDIAYLPTAPSAKRALDMNMKMNFIRDSNSGRGAYMLTATPVTNSPLEIYNMLALVCPVEEFEKFGVYTVDDFVRVFGQIQPVDKVRVDGSVAVKDGLVGFKNLSGLRSIFKKYVNMKNAADVNLELPPHDEIHDDVDMTPEQIQVYETLREKAKEAAKPGKKAREDSMFAVIRDMDRAVTDMDMYRRQMTFVFAKSDKDKVDKLISKLPASVEVDDIDEDGEKVKTKRLLETESFTQGNSYTVTVPQEYEEYVSSALAANGIAEETVTHPLAPKYAKLIDNMKTELETGGKQLVFTDEKSQHNKIRRIIVHNIPMANDKVGIINADEASGGKLQGISDSYNSGKLTVVIANKKAEVGVNLQKGTTAIHHLTLPWTPASIQQRNGRGVRQGNTAKKIHIYYYMGKGSFDGYRLDLLQRKSNWMRELFLGDAEDAENANVVNNDDYLDMLEADPEAAKARRMEILAKKAAQDKERRDKTALNQLAVLASSRKAINSIETDKAAEKNQIETAMADRAAKISDLQSKASSETDADKRAKIGTKVLDLQKSYDTLKIRSAKLDEKYSAKKTQLDSQIKQVSGVLRASAAKGDLPYSESLIDRPENAHITLDGRILEVGKCFEDSNGYIAKVESFPKDTDPGDYYAIKASNPIDSDGRSFGYRTIDEFLRSYPTPVTISESELQIRIALKKIHSYADLLQYDNDFYQQYRDKIKFKNSAFMVVYDENNDISVDEYSPRNMQGKVVFPAPDSDEYKKAVCMAAIRKVKNAGIGMDSHVGRGIVEDIFKPVFGLQSTEDAIAMIESSGKKATEAEIMTTCASEFQAWMDKDPNNNLDADASTIWNNIQAALSDFSNISEIRKIAQGYLMSKRDEMAAERARQKALDDQKKLEAIKSQPGYKEIPDEIFQAFKKIGVTVRVNQGTFSNYGSFPAFSRWFFQDSKFGGPLYRSKEVMKSRYGAKFFKDVGDFSGAWWHISSDTSLEAVYKLMA